MDENWLNEIKNCKKINKNIVIKNNRKSITDSLMEKLKNNKNHINEDVVADKFDYDYNYKLEKNESLGIDRNTDKRLKAGKIKIDLKVDFHGLTIDEAFDSLIKNVVDAYNLGMKLILVVTGKGNRTKEGRDSIKSLLGNWMKHPAISSRVIKYVDAQQKDGGSGAVYVLLKSRRSG